MTYFPANTFWTLFVFLLVPSLLYGQTGTIEGRVTDIDNETPIAGVNVGVKGSPHGDVTGDQGEYTITGVPEGTHRIVASFIGYETQEREITVGAGETVRVPFGFSASNIKLQEVEVVGRAATTYDANYSFVATKTATPVIEAPQSISVVTKEVLDDQQAQRLDDAINNVSGVTTFSGYNDITARGFRSTGTRLVNGLKAGFSFWNQPLLTHIERVEVIKGPASALFSNTNPGGTINLVTKKPLAHPRQSVSFTTGNFSTYRTSADFTGPMNEERTLLYRLNLGYENAGSFRQLQFNESYLIAPSISFFPTDQTQVNADLVYANLNTRLDRGQAIFNETDNLTSTPVSFSLSQPGDFMHNRDFHVTLSLSHQFSDRLSLNASYMKYRYDHDLEEHRTSNVFLPNDPMTLQLAFIKRKQERLIDNLTSYLTADVATGPVDHQVLVGLDYFQQDDNRTQWGARGDEHFITATADSTPGGNVGNFSLTDPTYTIEGRNSSTYRANWFSQPWLETPARAYTSGVYVQDQLTIGQRLDVLLALRQEFYRNRVSSGDGGEIARQTALIPRVGVVYGLLDGLNLYGTYAQGFEPQSASTILQQDQLGGPFDPETSDLVETGFKSSFFKDRLLVTAAAYRIKKRNILVNANVPGRPNLLEQRGEVTSRGVELEATGQLSSQCRITANYAYNRARITESDDPAKIGRINENAPEHMGGAWARYTVPQGLLSGLGVGGGIRFVTERNTFEQTLQLPDYTVADASIYYETGRFEISALLKNVTDATYWVGGYNYGRIYPGWPRRYLVKVGYSF